MLRVKWTDKRTNENVLTELNTRRLLLTEIGKRRLKYVGHAVRHSKTSLMSSVLTYGKSGRKKKTGKAGKEPC